MLQSPPFACQPLRQFTSDLTGLHSSCPKLTSAIQKELRRNHERAGDCREDGTRIMWEFHSEALSERVFAMSLLPCGGCSPGGKRSWGSATHMILVSLWPPITALLSSLSLISTPSVRSSPVSELLSVVFACVSSYIIHQSHPTLSHTLTVGVRWCGAHN